MYIDLTVADPAPLGVTPGGAGVCPEHVARAVPHHQHRGALVANPGTELLSGVIISKGGNDIIFVLLLTSRERGCVCVL